MESKFTTELFEEGHISSEQFDLIDDVNSGRRFSVFYELRTILYLGVLLFTNGIGFLIYDNISEAGHWILNIALWLATGACVYYSFKKGNRYSHKLVLSPSVYFDYVLLLGCLLLLSSFAHFVYLTGLFENQLEYFTLIGAIVFFYLGYRFDHLGVLSLGITSLTSFFGMSVSPKDWYSSGAFDNQGLYFTGMALSFIMAGTAYYLDREGIKKHFTDTYFIFASMIFCMSMQGGIWTHNGQVVLYSILQIAGAFGIAKLSTLRKKPLLLLIAFIFGYIGLSMLFFEMIDFDPILWFFYMTISCMSFVFFVIHFVKFYRSV